jgi:hypothetical protein
MKAHIDALLNRKSGVFRMVPTFVPRRNGEAGRRLRLHPDDYFALGMKRGAMKERWFTATIPANNGPLAPENEGLSYVAVDDQAKERVLFRDLIEEGKSDAIGETLMKEHGGWPMYSKFFDYNDALFHHLHLSFADAATIGLLGKPEAYFFPPQLNNHAGTFPHTYFGYDMSVTKDEVRQRLEDFEKGDNRITELSRAYRLELGTGWYTPPGVAHAPGSYLTYEPQWNADVNSVHENIVAGEIYPWDFLVESCPDDKKRDMDYIMSLLDWEKNIDPDYRRHYFRPPVTDSSKGPGFTERWIVYGNEYFSATELTVPPGATVTVTDPAAYGAIVIQGYGTINDVQAESVTLLRYGQMSSDEFFVTYPAATRGVKIHNRSLHEPLVILKHFGPDNAQENLSNGL